MDEYSDSEAGCSFFNKPNNCKLGISSDSDSDTKDAPEDGCDNFSDDDYEMCAICLEAMKGEIGIPDSCSHEFCLDCLVFWSKNNPTCPKDRQSFKEIHVKCASKGPVVQTISIDIPLEEDITFTVENQTLCEVCGSGDREDRLLLCDGCDLGYHLECLDPPLLYVPIEEWYCRLCSIALFGQPTVEVSSEISCGSTSKHKHGQSRNESRDFNHRAIPRTLALEKVRVHIRKTRSNERKKNSKKIRRRRNKKGHTEEEFAQKKLKWQTQLSLFGSIYSDDIDAAYINDDYADYILSSKEDLVKSKKDNEDVLEHNNYADSSSDVLSNILSKQDVLLSSSEVIKITDDRKLAKTESYLTLKGSSKNISNKQASSFPDQDTVTSSSKVSHYYSTKNNSRQDRKRVYNNTSEVSNINKNCDQSKRNTNFNEVSRAYNKPSKVSKESYKNINISGKFDKVVQQKCIDLFGEDIYEGPKVQLVSSARSKTCGNISVKEVDKSLFDSNAGVNKSKSEKGCNDRVNVVKNTNVENSSTNDEKKSKTKYEAMILEEVKKYLDPFYRDNILTKEDYKKIAFKCVQKITEAEKGKLFDTGKVQHLVTGYVKVHRHRLSKAEIK